jgi:hypothetical protein
VPPPAPPPATVAAVTPPVKGLRPREPREPAPPREPPPPAPPTTTAPPAASSAGGAVATNLTESAQNALEKNDKKAAAQMAQRATQREPGNAEAWLTLGAAFESMGRRDLAIGAYRSCAKQAGAHQRVSECKALAGIKDE